MPVFLRNPDVQRGVTTGRRKERMRKRQLGCVVLVWQAEGPQPFTKASCLENVVVEAEVADLERSGNGTRIDPDLARRFVGEPEIHSGEIASCHALPMNCALSIDTQRLVRIEEVDGCGFEDAIAGNLELAIPDDHATASSIFGTLPKYPNPSPVPIGLEWTIAADRGCAVKNRDTLDRSGTENVDTKRSFACAFDDVPHQGASGQPMLGRSQRRIGLVDAHMAWEFGGDLKVKPIAGSAVVPPLAQGIEYGRAGELGKKEAGQAADRAEQ